MTDTLDRITAALQDRYRIERELGAGGMATVYLAGKPERLHKRFMILWGRECPDSKRSSILSARWKLEEARMVRKHRAAGAFARPPILPDEPERLAALRHYEILDTPPERALDDLTLLAAQICQTPIALVSLVDSDRQWFKSKVGVEVSETPRDVAFCAHAIAGREMLIVPDTLQDERFAGNPLVVREPQIRFYAGALLRVAEGYVLGTLCVIDRVPRQLAEDQAPALEALARQVMAQLELRLQLAEVKRLAGMLPYCSSCGMLRTDLGDRCPDCVPGGVNRLH